MPKSVSAKREKSKVGNNQDFGMGFLFNFLKVVSERNMLSSLEPILLQPFGFMRLNKMQS